MTTKIKCDLCGAVFAPEESYYSMHEVERGVEMNTLHICNKCGHTILKDEKK